LPLLLPIVVCEPPLSSFTIDHQSHHDEEDGAESPSLVVMSAPLLSLFVTHLQRRERSKNLITATRDGDKGW